jgi:hypothetical protein
MDFICWVGEVGSNLTVAVSYSSFPPMPTDNPIQILDNAMKPIVNEMFQNGPEEGCRIWEDYSHPLNQAIQILRQARGQFRIKEAVALLEQHRRMEEGI